MTEAGDHVYVIVHRRTGDVDQHPCALEVCREPREVVVAHRLDAGVRETDGIEHAARELGHTWRGVPGSRLRGDRLGHDPTERVQIDDVAHLAAEAGSAGSEQDWVLERRVEQPNCRHRPLAGAATASFRSNSRRYATIPSAMALAILC